MDRYLHFICHPVYPPPFGETKRPFETRLKEHKEGCVKCQADKPATAEHAWSKDHPYQLEWY